MSNGFQYNITHHESSCHIAFLPFSPIPSPTYKLDHCKTTKEGLALLFSIPRCVCNCAYFYNGSRRKDKYCHVAQGNTFMTHVLVCYWACGLLNANKSLPLIGCFQINFIDLAWNQALDVMCRNKCSLSLLTLSLKTLISPSCQKFILKWPRQKYSLLQKHIHLTLIFCQLID